MLDDDEFSNLLGRDLEPREVKALVTVRYMIRQSQMALASRISAVRQRQSAIELDLAEIYREVESIDMKLFAMDLEEASYELIGQSR